MTPDTPQKETSFDETHRDQYAGQGGSYEIGPDGKRRLVGRTLSPVEASAIAAAGDEVPENR
jgi:hypothetical protein